MAKLRLVRYKNSTRPMNTMLGRVRRPESNYGHHRINLIYKNPPLQTKLHMTRGFGATPGWNGDPVNKRLISQSARDRRFEKWLDMPQAVKRLHWRVRPEQVPDWAR